MDIIITGFGSKVKPTYWSSNLNMKYVCIIKINSIINPKVINYIGLIDCFIDKCLIVYITPPGTQVHTVNLCIVNNTVVRNTHS